MRLILIVILLLFSKPIVLLGQISAQRSGGALVDAVLSQSTKAKQFSVIDSGLGLNLNFVMHPPVNHLSPRQFISIGAHALSTPFLLNPNEWEFDGFTLTDDSASYWGIGRGFAKSGWSTATRYNYALNKYVKLLLQSDNEKDSNYVYRWRFEGVLVKNDYDYSVRITVPIERKSYYSALGFGKIKNYNNAIVDSIGALIGDILIKTYSDYFK